MSYSREGSQKSENGNEKQRTGHKLELHNNINEYNKLQKANECNAINADE